MNLTSCTDASIAADRSYSDLHVHATPGSPFATLRERGLHAASPPRPCSCPAAAGSRARSRARRCTSSRSCCSARRRRRCPTSRRWTGAPLRYATIMLANAAASSSWPVACTVSASLGPQSTPVGMLTFWLAIAAVSRPRARCRGRRAAADRAACAPRTSACRRRAPGPRRSPSTGAARSSSRRTRRASRAAATSDVSASVRIGASAGFVFWYDGGMMPCGSVRSVCVIAACTSCAAASMLRSSANCTTICVCPRLRRRRHVVDAGDRRELLLERRRHGRRPSFRRWRPASVAVTVIVGKSTFGRSLTGNRV